MANSKNGYKTITFRLHAPEAQNVSIVGTFNDWNVSSHPMKRCGRGKNSYWQLLMRLEPGTYQYLYVVDGQWWNDPTSNRYMTNEFGTLNSVVEVE